MAKVKVYTWPVVRPACRVTAPEDARPGLTVAEIALPVSLKAAWGVALSVTTLDDVDRATPVPAFRLRAVPGETKSPVSPAAVAAGGPVCEHDPVGQRAAAGRSFQSGRLVSGFHPPVGTPHWGSCGPVPRLMV